MQARISLNEHDFRLLVNGGVVTHEQSMPSRANLVCEIALQDIGFDRMCEIMAGARERAALQDRSQRSGQRG